MMQLVRRTAHRLYARRLRARLAGTPLPRHIAMVMDGNRRWDRQMGFDDPKVGHRYGAEHMHEGLTPDPGHGVYAAGVSVAGAGRVLFS
ncbi:hypothetical protein ABGB16_32775 [Micromonospora sp. B11E3]|uniref:hypothetical protein n=1 Tax=Micromonospora sp. B11E3 TaxID=3153562 RepID=UPI00325C3EF6